LSLSWLRFKSSSRSGWPCGPPDGPCPQGPPLRPPPPLWLLHGITLALLDFLARWRHTSGRPRRHAPVRGPLPTGYRRMCRACQPTVPGRRSWPSVFGPAFLAQDVAQCPGRAERPRRVYWSGVLGPVSCVRSPGSSVLALALSWPNSAVRCLVPISRWSRGPRSRLPCPIRSDPGAPRASVPKGDSQVRSLICHSQAGAQMTAWQCVTVRSTGLQAGCARGRGTRLQTHRQDPAAWAGARSRARSRPQRGRCADPRRALHARG
jgi:hypothetical protein